MLGGVIKGDLQLNKNINKYLDMCLKCNACRDFCPSGIDAREIFLAAKGEYFKKNPNSKWVELFQSKLVFTSVLKLAKFASSTYRFLKVDKILPTFYPMLLKMGDIGKKIILANEFVSLTPQLRAKQKSADGELKANLRVVYFKGCVNEFINPSVKNAAEKVLNKIGVEILPINFECCGVPFLSGGNFEQFKKQAKFNLSQIPDEFDYFLTDCASCQNAFEEYKKVIEDEDLLAKLDSVIQKSVNINEFVSKNITDIEFEKKVSVTFHKPCHLEELAFLDDFLKKSTNLEYIEMKYFDKCCGFSGEFAIKNSKLSEKISKKKIKNALDTKADCILTSCPACKLGLIQGLIENEEFVPVLNFIEFIAMGL